MSTTREEVVSTICQAYGKDRGRLLDIARDVQEKLGCVDGKSVNRIAEELSIPRVEVESLVSFYSFLYSELKGQVRISLCNDVPDRMKGADRIAAELEEELGIQVGETTPDGRFSLQYASCSMPPASVSRTRLRRRWSTTLWYPAWAPPPPEQGCRSSKSAASSRISKGSSFGTMGTVTMLMISFDRPPITISDERER